MLPLPPHYLSLSSQSSGPSSYFPLFPPLPQLIPGVQEGSVVESRWLPPSLTLFVALEIFVTVTPGSHDAAVLHNEHVYPYPSNESLHNKD